MLARECYEAVLQREPRQPDALHLMGLIALAAQNIHAALAFLKMAASARPDDASIAADYAEALMQNADPIAAERQLRRALKLSPGHAQIQCRMARCQAMLGRPEEARRIYEALLAVEPENLPALLGYASLLLELGEREASETCYRKALHLGNVVEAFVGLTACRTFEGDPPELHAIENLIRREDLQPIELVRLSRATAKICDDIGRYDDAFRHCAQASAVLRGISGVEPTDHAEAYADIRALFTPDLLAKQGGKGSPSQKPVFIVGMPRSGTSLMEQIIGSHPHAAGGGELGLLRRIAEKLGFRGADRREFARRLRALTREEAATLAREALAMLERISGSAARITDKLPHNFELLGLVPILFPNSRIIHCRRAPLDTCVSCFLSPLDQSHDYAFDLRTLGAHYREYSTLMSHWREVLPGRILDVEYEALVADTEGETRRVISFIGLAWDSACLDFQSTGRAVRTISRTQVRRPVYQTSVGRWRHYDKHLDPLRQALGDLAH